MYFYYFLLRRGARSRSTSYTIHLFLLLVVVWLLTCAYIQYVYIVHSVVEVVVRTITITIAS